MTFQLNSNREELKLSEVNLKKILTEADVNFKFVVLKKKELQHTSEIECIDIPLTIQTYKQEAKLTMDGDERSMAKIVYLIQQHYGSLSDFVLTSDDSSHKLTVDGSISKEDIQNFKSAE